MTLVNRLKRKMELKILENATRLFFCSRCNKLGMLVQSDHYGFYLTCLMCGELVELDYFEVELLLDKPVATSK